MALHSSDLKKYNYFSSVSDESLSMLAQMLVPVDVSSGVEVVKEGLEGDYFYFVKSGRLEMTRQLTSGQIAKLCVIGSGQGFGETALLTCSSRSCTVRAVTPASLWRLAKADFDTIVHSEASFKTMLLRKAQEFTHYNKLKTLPPFALLDPDKMFAVIARMSERTYALGEDIIVQGEKGDFYYIIKTGRVAVLQKKKGETETKQVAILSDGDAFGEEALIRDDPRNATCRAIEETVVLVLDKVDFDHIMKSSFLDNIFTEDISIDRYREKYIVIDARVPAEYEQEHIDGAVNIPTEILRKRCIHLDPQKTYITYCTNDARGMVAAFLLNNHGFNAKCLRGGISSWTGPLASGQDKAGPAVSAV